MNRGDLQIYNKGGMRVVHEYFPSIHQMLKVLDSRPNNEVMAHEHSSTDTGNPEWAGTKTYHEAVELLTGGYTAILNRLRLNIDKAVKALNNFPTRRSAIIEDVQGASPIIPNYLIGLPNAMSYRQPVVRKKKTINIIYCPCENCGADPEEFIQAGVAVLSAIRVIEKSNISIRLDCMFSDSICNDEAVIGTVRIKNYGDRLDLQKLCFPLANAAMLRRIGFKYLETAPDMLESGFSFGYGKTPKLYKLEEFLKLPDSTVLINMGLVNGELEHDPKKVIEYINKKVKNN